MVCPCKNCICIPICRLKTYPVLVGECNEVWDYLISPFPTIKTRNNGKLCLIHKLLKPTDWHLIYDEFDRPIVENRSENCQFTFYY